MFIRFFSRLLVLAVSLGLAACGGGGSEPDHWSEFGNGVWEGFPPEVERKIRTMPAPSVPQVANSQDPAFFPFGMQSEQYRTPGWMQANGFTHGVVMLNAVTVYPRDDGYTAMVEIRAMRLLCRNRSTKAVNVQAEMRVGRGQVGEDGFKFETYHRSPGWFTSGIATTKITPTMSGIAAVIDPRANPHGIFHAWTNPRFELQPNCDYFVSVDARITGDARLQIGMDYWRGPWVDYNWYSDGCVTSNNCQGFLGPWQGDTKGFFVTLYAPFHP